MHVSSPEQASIVLGKNKQNKTNKRNNTMYKNKNLGIDDMRSLAEFLRCLLLGYKYSQLVSNSNIKNTSH
ncbi:hypothetical protein CXF95_26790 [Paraglaciecola sp. MB-3u-78]|nr:hypothetical protein CXF95_26790 [Paraglaciecola sp. MB-3u-78]